MKIRAVRTLLLSHVYPEEPKLAFSGGFIASWDAAIVELETEDGLKGYGEVAQGIMAAAAVPGVVDALRQYLIGRTIDEPGALADRLRDSSMFWARGGVASGTIGAVEAAAWDAKGKREGKPAFQIMGGAVHNRLELYASGGLGTTAEEVVAWSKNQTDAGFKTVKFRALRNPSETAEMLRNVVPKLPAGVRFVIDAVQGCAASPWTVDDAIRVGRVAADLGARWFEEPCRSEDVAGYAAVRKSVGVPISGVESYSSPAYFDLLFGAHGVDIAQPDASMIGGPTELRRVVEKADARGLQVVPHVWGTGVTLMTNAHTAFATASMPLIEFCTIPNPLREALLAEPLRIEDGYLLPPTAPGLGVAVPAELELEHRFQLGGGHVIFQAVT